MSNAKRRSERFPNAHTGTSTGTRTGTYSSSISVNVTPVVSGTPASGYPGRAHRLGGTPPVVKGVGTSVGTPGTSQITVPLSLDHYMYMHNVLGKDILELKRQYKIEISYDRQRSEVVLKSKSDDTQFAAGCNSVKGFIKFIERNVVREEFLVKSLVDENQVIQEIRNQHPKVYAYGAHSAHARRLILYGEQNYLDKVYAMLQSKDKIEPRPAGTGASSVSSASIHGTTHTTLHVNATANTSLMTDFQVGYKHILTPFGRGGKATTIIIKKANILNESVDVIVNSANSSLLHVGGVAKAIAKAAGKDLARDCKDYIKKHGELMLTAAMHTRPGKLHCTWVVHAVGPDVNTHYYEDLLRATLSNVFRECTKLQARTVAIPAIGTGVYGIPVSDFAYEMMCAIEDSVARDAGCPIQEIIIVDIHPATVLEIIDVFNERWPDVSNPHTFQHSGQSSPYQAATAPPFEANVRWPSASGGSRRDAMPPLHSGASSNPGCTAWDDQIPWNDQITPVGAAASSNVTGISSTRKTVLPSISPTGDNAHGKSRYSGGGASYSPTGDKAHGHPKHPGGSGSYARTDGKTHGNPSYTGGSGGYSPVGYEDLGNLGNPAGSGSNAPHAPTGYKTHGNPNYHVGSGPNAPVGHEAQGNPSYHVESGSYHMPPNDFSKQPPVDPDSWSDHLKNNNDPTVPSPSLGHAAAVGGSGRNTDDPKDAKGPISGDKPNGAKDANSKSEDDNCPICFCDFTDKETLKCNHSFCKECLDLALKFKNACPVCNTILGEQKGNQPTGKMDVNKLSQSLPGYDRCGTIQIDYHFPDGIQTDEHPNPGKHYHGTSRTGFLPDNPEGREVLKLLRRAFDARVTFTIGRSNTTGKDNCVIWNDIHHKTCTYGGPTNFGYPDPTYLSRVKDELAAKGITPDT